MHIQHLNVTAMKKQQPIQPSSAETTPTSDLQKEELKGPVKQVMQVTYTTYMRGNSVKPGKITGSSLYDNKNTIICYNEQGQKVRERKFEPDSSEEYFYNEKGQLAETRQYNAIGLLNHVITVVYNARGSQLESINTKADGTLHWHVKHTYNNEGLPVYYIHESGPERRIAAAVKYEYNQWNKPTLITHYNSQNEVSTTTRYSYNEQGLETERVSEHTNPDAITYNQRITKKYNNHGDCIENTHYDHNGNIKHLFTYTHEYDSNGNKIVPPPPYRKTESRLKEGETEKLQTDHHGNWITRTVYALGIPRYITMRSFQYYAEDSANQPDFVHPILATPKEQKHKEEDPLPMPEKAEMQWVAEMPNSSAEVFPGYRYYIAAFREIPSSMTIQGPHIEAIGLMEYLKRNNGAYLIHSHNTVWNGNRDKINRYTLAFRGTPYLLQSTGISDHSEEEYIVPEYVSDFSGDFDQVHLSAFQLLRPSDSSELRDEYFEDILFEAIDEFTLRKKPDKPTIHTIEVKGGNFIMVEHPVNDKFEIRDLDVNYGQGFAEFHNELMKRFHSETTGLVLFHGRPGTGKTFYIRHLLRKMTSANRKVVIYMPPNMVDHLTDPAFMTFLTDEVKDYSSDGYFCVLLIEDAEPLLARRQEGVRIQGVTNLLNMSDGLLNDMLKLQIICTFNVDLKKLDSALLRPGRLLARKEFKALSVLDANLLAQRLGIKHHFKKPATLAEVYSMRQNKNTLVHDTEPDQDSSTVLDDLL